MQVASVSASLRQGIRMVSSIACGVAGTSIWAKRFGVLKRLLGGSARRPSLSVDGQESRHLRRQSLKKPMRWTAVLRRRNLLR